MEGVGMEWRHWVALALLAGAAWAAWLRVKRARQIKAMQGWTQVNGRILSHDIEETSSTDSDGRLDHHYDPKISYEYEVGGRTRQGTRLALETVSFGSRKKAQQYLDARPVGSTVPVFVNPDDPSDSVLTTKASGDWWVPVFFAGLAAAVGLGFFG